MPEYLAPGVFVEETSFRAKSIEGVGTSTAAFVGMTARGPIANLQSIPILLTSFVDFEEIYGGVDNLTINGKSQVNYLAHAARAFFANGGGRLYVARVPGTDNAAAKAVVKADADADKSVTLTARDAGGAKLPGSDANYRVGVFEVLLPTTKTLALKQPVGTMVRTPADAGAFEYYLLGNPDTEGPKFKALADSGQCEVVTLSVEVYAPSGLVYEASNLALDRRHVRYIENIMGDNPPRARDRLTNPVKLVVGAKVAAKDLRDALTKQPAWDLKDGLDGKAPGPSDIDKALAVLLALDDVSMVAAPGLTEIMADKDVVNAKLIEHVTPVRAYRIAVMDTQSGLDTNGVQQVKGKIDHTRAALYYPWLSVANPLAGSDPLQPTRINLPPSGHVCGIYARTDIQRGVWKAPANEVVNGALGLETAISFGEQEKLNPLGINCIRALPNRGIRVWGARTTSSDPEWKYVNIRRYFLYLESSIDRGTQWAVFEPNGEALWANVRTTISDFLYNEWVSGALLGATAKEAFFVHCDRSTMTQNDLDNGRLICLIGVAAIKPAEFVIFRIGQKTADARG